MIQTLEGERINVKELTYGESHERAGGPFDPMKKISHREIATTVELFTNINRISSMGIFISRLSALYILDPEVFSLKRMPQEINDSVQKCLIDPNHESDIMPDSLDMLLLDKHSVEILRTNDAIYRGASYLKNSDGLRRMVFPEFPLEMNSDKRNLLQKEIDTPTKDIFRRTENLAQLKLFYPEEFNSHFTISNNEWGVWKEKYLSSMNVLSSASQADQIQFIYFCSFLRILAAKKIEITDRGIRFEFPENNSFMESPKQPVLRRF